MNGDRTYIRMKEAINEFGKTRQTFYNYINKWQIATKKIHNKLYLSVRDIKRITWDYIWEQYISNKNTETLHWTDSTHEANYQILKNQISHIESKIKLIPNEFSMYTQQMNLENKQYTDVSQSKLQWYIKNIQEYIDTSLFKMSHSLKKYKFAVWYLFAVIVNAIIVLVLV